LNIVQQSLNISVRLQKNLPSNTSKLTNECSLNFAQFAHKSVRPSPSSWTASCHEWLITHWLHQLLKVGVAKTIVTQPIFGKNVAQILCFCCFCRNDRKPRSWCWLALKRQLIGNSIASAFKVQQWSTLFCEFHEKIHRMSHKKRFNTSIICTWKKKVCRL
jgi:hypothetical protein